MNRLGCLRLVSHTHIHKTHTHTHTHTHSNTHRKVSKNACGFDYDTKQTHTHTHARTHSQTQKSCNTNATPWHAPETLPACRAVFWSMWFASLLPCLSLFLFSFRKLKKGVTAHTHREKMNTLTHTVVHTGVLGAWGNRDRYRGRDQ